MMVPDELDIVGISSVGWNVEQACLWAYLVLSDGSIASTWWPAQDLKRFIGIVSPATHRPTGARVQ